MSKAILAALAITLAGAAPVLAANADTPYQNVDRRNDAGNDTGNARVDSLNNGQLDRNQGTPAPALGRTPPSGPAPEVPARRPQ